MDGFHLMKFKLLLLFMFSCGLSHAISVRDYDKGLLVNSNIRFFVGNGVTKVNVLGTSSIKMRSDCGSILLYGNGWEFEGNRVLSNDLGLIDPKDFRSEDVHTIVASFENQSYDIGFVKHYRRRRESLRIISVTPTIPEPSSWALLAGITTGTFALLKRR